MSRLGTVTSTGIKSDLASQMAEIPHTDLYVVVSMLTIPKSQTNLAPPKTLVIPKY